MTTVSPIFTGAAAHIGKCADAVTVSRCGTQIFVSERQGCAKTANRLSKTLSASANGSPAKTMYRPAWR
jgi:hypothetical protein